MILADTLPHNPERTGALRKLLEAEDCAVRAKLWVGPPRPAEPPGGPPFGTGVPGSWAALQAGPPSGKTAADVAVGGAGDSFAVV
jgi:hypothetical protein